MLGKILDDTTFGTRGKDLADLSDDSLDLVGNIDKISLGDGGIGVEDMVDSVDDILELGSNISDDTTFGTWGQNFSDLSNDCFNLVGNIDKISLGSGLVGAEDMVDSIHNSLELFGKILDDTTFGTWGEDFADLTNDSLDFVGNIEKISLGSCRCDKLADFPNNSLQFVGEVEKINTTFGTRGKDLANLSNDSLDLVGDVDKIPLGDGGIGVEDMVDSVDDVLELGGNISNDTTFVTRGKDLANLSNDSLNFLGNIEKISLGDGSIGVEDMVDSIDNVLKLGGNISDDTTFGTSRGQDMADLSNDSFQFLGNIDKISLGGIGVEDMVGCVVCVLAFGGSVCGVTTFGTRGKD